ncbi:hypothetical protein KDN24_02295 [Bacillus sp. Bva_UNVM-123]|uniref:hypothetical protein n=1 Tax=Bacillus sp. Bva_UNVM-123 TaxID=2829798 RepID=UPI00391F4BCE
MDRYTVIFLWIFAIVSLSTFIIYVVYRLSVLNRKINLLLNHFNIKDENELISNLEESKEQKNTSSS